jgi:hypothetical protein
MAEAAMAARNEVNDMFSSVGNQWRMAIGLAAIIGLSACHTDKPVNPGTKDYGAGAVIVTGEPPFAPDGRKYGVTVVSAPKLVTQLDHYSFTDSPPSLDAGDEYLTLSVRLTNADGDGSEQVPISAGLPDMQFRITIPNSAYDSLANKQWTNVWASCLAPTLPCSGYLAVASTDPASSKLDFMSNRPEIGNEGVTIVMYVTVPQGFETVLDQAQLMWFRVAGKETQTTVIPLPKS